MLARVPSAVVTTGLVVLIPVMLLPVIWIVVQSVLRGGKALKLPPVWLPTNPTLHSYAQVFKLAPFVTFFINSIKITSIVTLGSLVTSSLAAYAFARLRSPVATLSSLASLPR